MVLHRWCAGGQILGGDLPNSGGQEAVIASHVGALPVVPADLPDGQHEDLPVAQVAQPVLQAEVLQKSALCLCISQLLSFSCCRRHGGPRQAGPPQGDGLPPTVAEEGVPPGDAEAAEPIPVGDTARAPGLAEEDPANAARP